MARIALLALLALALTGCGGPTTQLQRIERSGELTVVTRNGPTTYYEGANGPAGFEYDLARMFADYLGVSLKIKVADSVSAILPMVIDGKADLAAAGLAMTKRRAKRVRFGPSYYQVTPELIYRVGTRRPADLDDLDGHVEVVAGSSNAELLKRLTATHPKLAFRTNSEVDSDELLYLVYQQLIDYTVADSNMVAINQQYYPELHVAFKLSAPRKRREQAQKPGLGLPAGAGRQPLPRGGGFLQENPQGPPPGAGGGAQLRPCAGFRLRGYGTLHRPYPRAPAGLRATI
ncbi:MAG: transporter substrate-binding domain-containing protein [Gammaproteobacteria bacterium]